jgi:hypothetical protein
MFGYLLFVELMRRVRVKASAFAFPERSLIALK